MIRPATADDAAAICAIYNYYIANTTITFEEDAISETDMERRIADVNARHCWLVHEENGIIEGYAYATQWRVRSAYRYSAETTVYVKPGGGNKGIGTELYTRLIAELRKRGIRVAIGGIALPNAASVALHERMGFAQAAHFIDVGYKFGKWIDVGYWELALKDKASN